MKYSELKKKEVINIKCCQKLGKIVDLEMDECTGKVNRIIVSGRGILPSWLYMEPDYVIPWCNIRQIGSDLINVDL